MTQYLLSVVEPTGDGTLPPDLDQIMADVTEVDRQMREAGAWVFAGGLHSPKTATVVRVNEGEVLTTDGPYVEGKEHIGGFTILAAPDLDAALEWAGRYAAATTLPIEVRPFR
jgi:hypothetical protein